MKKPLLRFRILMTENGISPRLDPDGDWVRWHDVADLIAAAPDMYEALKSCPLPSTMGSRDDHYQRFYDWYNKHVIAALSKADAMISVETELSLDGGSSARRALEGGGDE